jgi:Leucine rich repeat
MTIIEQAQPRARKQKRSKEKNLKRNLQTENESSNKPQLITTSTIRALQTDQADSRTLRLKHPTSTLPPSFFTLFSSLRVLDLRNLGLRTLPGQIIELRNLEKLDLRYNQLTYLPSQLAELPDLATLQLDDLRDRKTGLLKDLDERMTTVKEEDPRCCCIPNSGGDLVPPIPTLSQLCTRAVLSSIPPLAADDTGGLSWEELESHYHAGGGPEEGETASLHGSFAHVLPKTFPFDICSVCSQPVCPAHAQFDKIQTIALRRVRLRYILCSHQCYSSLVGKWNTEMKDAKAKLAERQSRFRIKQDDIPR